MRLFEQFRLYSVSPREPLKVMEELFSRQFFDSNWRMFRLESGSIVRKPLCNLGPELGEGNGIHIKDG